MNADFYAQSHSAKPAKKTQKTKSHKSEINLLTQELKANTKIVVSQETQFNGSDKEAVTEAKKYAQRENKKPKQQQIKH